MVIQQSDNPRAGNGFVSLVSLNPQLVGHTIQSAHQQHPGQIIIQTNESNQSSYAYSTSEPQQIQILDDQQPTLLLVTANPDDNSGQLGLTREIIKNPQQPIQMQQQLVLLTDSQGTSQGAILQMPSSASVIQVPGLVSNGDQTLTFIGAPQSDTVVNDTSNTLFVANSGNGEIILCLQPGEVTTLQIPSTLVVDGSNACFAATIDSQPEEASPSDLARSWQIDSDLVNRALNALSSTTSVHNSLTNLTSVETTNSGVVHLCPHVPPLH